MAELARLRFELYVEQDGERRRVCPRTIASGSRASRSAALASEDWRAWVARIDDELVGAMWLHTVHRVPVPGKRAGPIGYLTNVYVDRRNSERGARRRDARSHHRLVPRGRVLGRDRVADGAVAHRSTAVAGSHGSDEPL